MRSRGGVGLVKKAVAGKSGGALAVAVAMAVGVGVGVAERRGLDHSC